MMRFPQPTKKYLKSYALHILLLSLSLSLFFSLILYPGAVSAAQVVLAWNENDEPEVLGYKLYWGTSSGVYPFSVDVGNQTTYTLSGLEVGKIHHFMVTAYDAEGNESPPSEEVYFLLPAEGEIADVPPGYWAEEAIHKIFEAGITTGCSDNPLQYCPESAVTRVDIAVFLGRAIHGPDFPLPEPVGIFDDVPVTHSGAAWIEQLCGDGITSGCDQNNLYCPDMAVTRAAAAVLLLRGRHGGDYFPPAAKGVFADVSVTHWAADWIEQLYAEGIMEACITNPKSFCPDKILRRDVMAVLLVKAFGL